MDGLTQSWGVGAAQAPPIPVQASLIANSGHAYFLFRVPSKFTLLGVRACQRTYFFGGGARQRTFSRVKICQPIFLSLLRLKIRRPFLLVVVFAAFISVLLSALLFFFVTYILSCFPGDLPSCFSPRRSAGPKAIFQNP